MKKKFNERVILMEAIVLRKIQLNYLNYDKSKIDELKFNLSHKETIQLYELFELYEKEFKLLKVIKNKKFGDFDINPN